MKFAAKSKVRFLRGAGAALCLLSLALAGCSKHAGPKSGAENILRLSQRNEPADLDPATASLPDEFFIIRALSEGPVTPAPLTSDHAESGVLPGAAERWDISNDGLTYTFHLRQNARWSNDEPVTASDFVASYRRVLTPATGAPKAALFFMVKNARAFASGQLKEFAAVGISAPDTRTLVVTLERPFPQFLIYAASGPWIPVNPRIVARAGRSWTRPENFVGNGPFTLAEWRPHQRIIVKKDWRYHSPSEVKLDEIHFIAFDNGDTEERAYRAGQIDVTMAVPATKLDSYLRERPAELHHAALAETRYLTFNTTRPPLNDARVRHALALAIDRQKIVTGILKGGHVPASRFLAPQLVSGNETPAHESTFAADEARQLLADAGFAGGRGFPRLELSTWPATPIVEAIQAMWQKELGITVSLVTREAKVHLTALREGSYDIGYVTTIIDVPDAASLLDEFTTGAPGNYPHWSDHEYDSLLSSAAGTTDSARQRALLLSAEARLLDQCPVAPLYFNTRNWLMSPRVRGWQHDALWTRFYLNVDVTTP